MPFYHRLGSLPRKRHMKFPRDAATSFKGEGLHYEHVITTEGFDRAYSIVYHLKPPTLVKKVELFSEQPTKVAAHLPLRHHHLKSAGMARASPSRRVRVSALNKSGDPIAYSASPVNDIFSMGRKLPSPLARGDDNRVMPRSHYAIVMFPFRSCRPLRKAGTSNGKAFFPDRS